MSAPARSDFPLLPGLISRKGRHRIRTDVSEISMLGGRLRSQHKLSYAGSDITSKARDEIGSDAIEPRAGHLLVPLIKAPSPPQLDGGAVLQKWEGRVQELTDGGFVARLTDLTSDLPDEEAEFDVQEVSFLDRRLLKPGAVFYWSIGYRDAVTGQRSRESVIRFRRLPTWSKPDHAEAARRAAHWKNAIRWGE